MRRMLKWVGIILLALVVILLAGGAVLYGTASSRLNNGPDVAVKAVPAASDASAIARGQHLAVAISGCTSCHGEDLSGEVTVEDPAIGTIYAANLTAGEGGAGATFSDEDWARAIRHGIGPGGRVLGGMPSNAFAHLSDDDLAALLAYIQSVPPVDKVLPERRLSPPGTIIFGTTISSGPQCITKLVCFYYIKIVLILTCPERPGKTCDNISVILGLLNCMRFSST